MSFYHHSRTQNLSTRIFTMIIILLLCCGLTVPAAFADLDLNLPAPSKIKSISKPSQPVVLKAVTVDPKDPFLFDFLVDKGDSGLEGEALEAETQKLVKYFLAALTIPESDLWVNLSPYEKDAMVPQALGITELGKDLLVDDYMLKQVTAGLTNPNTETGKKFWDTAYARAQELYGTTKVPINTFSKVWIVPDQAVVLEKDGSAFVADSHLKVFLDEDYLAVKNNLNNKEIGTDKLGADKTQSINKLSSQLIKEIVLPAIEKEVNAGENFAKVRQIYSSAILAAWYKKRLKESILGQLYADKNKVAGVNNDDFTAGDQIFEKYAAALKTGVYNIIKQDYDLSSQKTLQRKYFSGGVKMAPSASTAVREMTPQAVASLSPRASSALNAAVTAMSSPNAAQNNYARATVRFSNTASASVTRVNDELQSNSFSRDVEPLQNFVSDGASNSNDAFVDGLRRISQADLELKLAGSDRELAARVLQAKRDLDDAVSKKPSSTVRELSARVAPVLPAISQDAPLRTAITSSASSALSLKKASLDKFAVVSYVLTATPEELVAALEKSPTSSLSRSENKLPLVTALKKIAAENPSAFSTSPRLMSALSLASTANAPIAPNDINDFGTSANISHIASLQQANVITSGGNVSPENVDREVIIAALAPVMYSAYTKATPDGDHYKAFRQQLGDSLKDPAVLKTPSASQKFSELSKALKNEAVKNVLGSFGVTSGRSSSSAVTPFQNILGSIKVASIPAEIKEVPQGSKLVEYFDGINKNTARQGKELNAEALTRTFQAIAWEAQRDKSFGQAIATAPNIQAFRTLVEAQLVLAPRQGSSFGDDVSMQDLNRLSDSDVRAVGGIDLSADKMGLQIKRDGNGVPLAFPMQDVGNLKIDGLAPVILDVQPATPQNTPFLMNLVGGNKN